MTLAQIAVAAAKAVSTIGHDGFLVAWAGVAAYAADRRAAAHRWDEFHALQDLSDADLHDIGLSRGDLESAAATVQAGEDPTLEVARLRQERQGW